MEGIREVRRAWCIQNRQCPRWTAMQSQYTINSQVLATGAEKNIEMRLGKNGAIVVRDGEISGRCDGFF